MTFLLPPVIKVLNTQQKRHRTLSECNHDYYTTFFRWEGNARNKYPQCIRNKILMTVCKNVKRLNIEDKMTVV